MANSRRRRRVTKNRQQSRPSANRQRPTTTQQPTTTNAHPSNSSSVSTATATADNVSQFNRTSVGHLNFAEGFTILNRFRVIRCLGEGMFGRVAAVEQIDGAAETTTPLVIKIVRNVERFQQAAVREVTMLRYLQGAESSNNGGRDLCVKMIDHFELGGHPCIVFEKFGISVYEFLERNYFHPFPMEQVRHIALQLVQAVAFLHEHRIAHTDLKPENMLFVTTEYDKVPATKQGHTGSNGQYRVMRHSNIRLVDFGSAIFHNQTHSRVVQTRHYRAPEVVMELGWSHSIDCWSIGCIIAELNDGLTPFPISGDDDDDDHEHLAMIERVLGGAIPIELAKRAGSGVLSQTKGASAHLFDTNGRLRALCATSLESVERNSKALEEYFGSGQDQRQLLDLTRRLLVVDSAKRTTLKQALQHKFFRASRSTIGDVPPTSPNEPIRNSGRKRISTRRFQLVDP